MPDSKLIKHPSTFTTVSPNTYVYNTSAYREGSIPANTLRLTLLISTLKLNFLNTNITKPYTYIEETNNADNKSCVIKNVRNTNRGERYSLYSLYNDTLDVT